MIKPIEPAVGRIENGWHEDRLRRIERAINMLIKEHNALVKVIDLHMTLSISMEWKDPNYEEGVTHE